MTGQDEQKRGDAKREVLLGLEDAANLLSIAAKDNRRARDARDAIKAAIHFIEDEQS